MMTLLLLFAVYGGDPVDYIGYVPLTLEIDAAHCDFIGEYLVKTQPRSPPITYLCLNELRR